MREWLTLCFLNSSFQGIFIRMPGGLLNRGYECHLGEKWKKWKMGVCCIEALFQNNKCIKSHMLLISCNYTKGTRERQGVCALVPVHWEQSKPGLGFYIFLFFYSSPPLCRCIFFFLILKRKKKRIWPIFSLKRDKTSSISTKCTCLNYPFPLCEKPLSLLPRASFFYSSFLSFSPLSSVLQFYHW